MADSVLARAEGEKIEQLITIVTEQSTTARIYLVLGYVVFPLLIGLLTFLAVFSYHNISRIEQLAENIVNLNEIMLNIDRRRAPPEPVMAPALGVLPPAP
jgi:hypothetical protein